jgi:hypothetical protein
MKQGKKRNRIEIVAAADDRVTWEFVGAKGKLAKSLQTYRSPQQARRAIVALRHADVVDRTASCEIEPPEAHFAFAADVDTLVAGEQARTARHRRRRRKELLERAQELDQTAEAKSAMAAELHKRATTQHAFAEHLVEASLEDVHLSDAESVATARRTVGVAQELAADADVQEQAAEVLEESADATAEEAEDTRDRAHEAAPES